MPTLEILSEREIEQRRAELLREADMTEEELREPAFRRIRGFWWHSAVSATL